MTEAASRGRFALGGSGKMLAVVATASLISFYGQLVIPPLLPSIVDDLGITPSRAGIALSLMWALIAICRFPGGRLADRLSPKTVLAGSFAIALVGLALVGIAGTYADFLLGVAAVGVGAGLYLPAALTLLTETFVGRRGRAFAINEIAINLGGVAAGLVAGAVLVVATWQTAVLPAILAFGFVAVLSHRWIDQPYVIERPSFDARGTGSRLIGDPRVLATLVAFALFSFSWQGVTSFLPSFLQAEKGFAPAVASNAFTGLFVVGILGNALVTPLGDRLGFARLAIGAAVFSATGLALLVVVRAPLWVVAGIVVFGLGATSFWPLLTAHFMGLLPDASMGGDYGAASSVFVLVGSLGSAYVGVVAESASYTVAFAGIVGCLVVATAVVIHLAIRRSG